MMKILQAINNNVTIELVDNGSNVVGDFVLPDSAVKESRWAKALTVGPGVPDINGRLITPDVSPGETIYVALHGKENIDMAAIGGDNVACVNVLDVLAVLKDEGMIQPLGNLIEIEKLELKEETENGILIPESHQIAPNIGIVKTVGKGVDNLNGEKVPIQVKVGDMVAYIPFSTLIVDYKPLGLNKVTYLVSQNDILGVINEVA